jgi:hypothetical protein
MHQLLYLRFYKYIIKVCTLKNWWWWGIVQCVETFTKNAPHPPPKNHLYNSWDSMLSVSSRPKFYPPKFRNWPNFSPGMTSACLYPQVHDFLIRCLSCWCFDDFLGYVQHYPVVISFRRRLFFTLERAAIFFFGTKLFFLLTLPAKIYSLVQSTDFLVTNRRLKSVQLARTTIFLQCLGCFPILNEENLFCAGQPL